MYKKYSTKKTEMHINQIQVQHAYNKDYYLYNIENMQGSLYVYGWAFVCEYEHVYVCACVFVRVCVCVCACVIVCVRICDWSMCKTISIYEQTQRCAHTRTIRLT